MYCYLLHVLILLKRECHVLIFRNILTIFCNVIKSKNVRGAMKHVFFWRCKRFLSLRSVWAAVFICCITILTYWWKDACCSVCCFLKIVWLKWWQWSKKLFYEANVELNKRDNVLSDWCTICDAYTRVLCVYTESLE